MKLVTSPRIEFLRGLSTEILHNYGRGRTIVAVDGTDGSGRETFADDLAAVLEERDHPAFRASLRYFQRPRAEQDKFGPETAERIYRHRDDYSVLKRVLLEPFHMGGSTGFVTRQFDPDSETWIQPTWLTAAPDATLVIDGDFLLRPELRSHWSFTVLLEGGPETPADELYQAEVRPNPLASAVVDNTDAANPQRRFFDSC
ncbi:MAG: hypothetical protein JWM23_321 [Microbacteriaceae bacterium]|jgi:hypothetical protein|nr:hypothetical protein [Microbacteriaceae bacterium]